MLGDSEIGMLLVQEKRRAEEMKVANQTRGDAKIGRGISRVAVGSCLCGRVLNFHHQPCGHNQLTRTYSSTTFAHTYKRYPSTNL